ncbi:hypothetical protein DFR33_104161 [Bradymonas sediminis]|nr:hypothetical protein DFR33_104161 [Bradymonas sediminis]
MDPFILYCQTKVPGANLLYIYHPLRRMRCP